MDCSQPGSSVPGISQAGILERVAISFSTGSSQPLFHGQASSLALSHLGSPNVIYIRYIFLQIFIRYFRVLVS